ncbi:SAM-dependent methyltransferase [Oceanospirillum beijerinckii]|uniref:SAM-dependent methyltransferase n=1 Tax=Oceanospirillum beijerinckii TaxID=64976 RepID=UPI0004127A38|nr:SAM-dependent methyltransferase [Oceanospirillum beijerinckii]
MTEQQSFSKSPIWQIQKEYYQQLGIETWGKAMVPFSATTNCFVAQGYAHNIAAFITDLQLQGNHQPVNIVELGTGHGRFSFMLLKALEDLYQDYPEKPYRYIMTDIAPVSIQAWSQHARLQPFIEEGVLDFSLFDAVIQQDTTLEVSGDSFTQTLAGKPLVVVANFLLDVLPYDLFRVKQGEIQPYYATLTPDEQTLSSLSPEDAVKQVELQSQIGEAQDCYYDVPEWNQLLEYYRNEINDSVVQMPVCVLQTLDFFNQLSPHSLWLIAEEASLTLEKLEGHLSTGIKKQGSFTTRVNLHAVQYLLNDGRHQFLHAETPDPRFDSYALIKSAQPERFRLSRNSFKQNLTTFGPRSFFRLFVNLRREKPAFNDDGMLSLIELSQYDPYFFRRFRYRILDACKQARSFQTKALVKALLNIWDNYYDIGEDFPIAYYLARTFAILEYHDTAIEFLSLALEHDQQQAPAQRQTHKLYYYLGLSNLETGQTELGEQFLRHSLSLGSEFKRQIEKWLPSDSIA